MRSYKTMSYILTYTKTEFYPLEPKIEDINITDISHALSLLCRANGHFKHFYSVGLHSINCAYEAMARGYSNNVILGCLLHSSIRLNVCSLINITLYNLVTWINSISLL